MKPIGQIPSPYGSLIDVFHDPSRSSDPDDCYFQNIDDIMTLAGVHGTISRDACRRDIQNSGRTGSAVFEIFLKNGGRRIAREKLPKPDHSTYKTMPKTGMEMPIESWISACMDAPDWYQRAHTMEDIIFSFTENAKRWDGNKPVNGATATLACQILLTAALEHLHEHEIKCIQAAAFYAVSTHDEWASAGLNWLLPIKDTWFKDWIAEHPAFADFARVCRLFSPSLPAWISGDRT